MCVANELDRHSCRRIFNARKRSLRRLCFYTYLSVHRREVVSQHALQVSRPTPSGGSLRGLAGGVSRPTPRGGVEGSGLGGVSRSTPRGEVEGSGWGGLQSHSQGSLQAHTGGWGVYPSMFWGRPPPPPPTHSWRLLLRAVRILLDCILVASCVHGVSRANVSLSFLRHWSFCVARMGHCTSDHKRLSIIYIAQTMVTERFVLAHSFLWRDNRNNSQYLGFMY